MTVPTQQLTLTRVFAAPRHEVWRALTEPALFARWFGPVGFSVPPEGVELDVRVGGAQRFVMVSDADPGVASPVDAVYTEVVPDELLAGHEQELELRMALSDVDGGTRLVLVQGPLPVEVVDVAGRGWESSFTRLDAVLAG